MVKTPKLYFLDTGLAAWLLGVKDTDTLNTHAQRGPLFETLVVTEFVKQRFNDGQPAALYFWRDNTGHEVDLLFEVGDRLQAIEIKSGATFVAEWRKALGQWQSFAGQTALPPWLIYGGEQGYFREGLRVFAWRDIPGAVRNL